MKLNVSRMCWFFLLFSFNAIASNRVAPLPDGAVKLKGFLGEKIDRVIANRIMAQQEDHLVEPFRHRTETRWWQSEFWGKWLLSAVDACRYSGDRALHDKISRAVAGLIATQTPDGYIGNYAPEAHLQQWDVWGRKYTLLGLLAWNDLTGDPKALAAARRLADFTLSEIGPGKANIVLLGNHRGMAASSILEPIALLYNRTGEKRYLDFARYIVSQWETGQGPQLISKALQGIPVAERFPKPAKWWTWEQGQKAYEMMSCYDGLAELYKIDKDDEFLQACLKAAQNILDTEINIIGSGSSVECWYGGKQKQAIPARHPNETCVTMTWLKYLFQLYKLTENPLYIDEIERTAYNALSASMTPDGTSFAKYTPLAGVRFLGEKQCGMELNCCTANGPRALLLLPQIAIMKEKEGIVVNLYESCTAAFDFAQNRIFLKLDTDYPKAGRAVLKVAPAKPADFTVKLRIPAWSSETKLALNGERVAARAGDYVTIRRRWTSGDSIEIDLDMRARVQYCKQGDFVFAAIERGPVVLARDKRFGPVDEDEVAQPVLKGNLLELEAVPSDEVWMLFRAPFVVGSDLEVDRSTPVKLYLCDFASAGNSWDETSRYRVWLPQLYDPSR